MEKKWESWIGFERLVAAIHIAETQGGVVKWNDIINGRQFDVSIKFKFGAYEYLTVIECRDYKTKVPVGDVEAFVTKTRDINSNKAIMVSPCGFQSGGISVAERHGIELLILNEEYAETNEMLSMVLVPMVNICNIVFIRNDIDGEYSFPNSIGGKLLYLVKKGLIEASGKTNSLEKILSHWQAQTKIVIDHVEKNILMKLPDGAILIIPPDNERIPVKEMRFSVQLVDARKISRSALDPLLEANKQKLYSLRKPNGKLVMTKQAEAIPIGFDTPLKKGCFYTRPDSDFKYYCEKIEKDEVQWILVESYQHGELLQVDFTQGIEGAIETVKGYLLVEDDKEIARLNNMLRKIQKPKS
jgi:hypothetical protein